MEIIDQDIVPSPEVTTKKEYTYPKEYFATQIEFAKKVVDLKLANDLPEAILKFTSLYRRITDKKYDPNAVDEKWLTLKKSLTDVDGQDKELETLWSAYTNANSHEYSDIEIPEDGHHFGSYIYKDAIDEETGLQKIELHFNIRNRGMAKSDFSREYAADRKRDLKKLFSSVKNRMNNDPHFKPEFVTLGSWMNNLEGVKESLPPEFVASGKKLVPPDLSFNGDSLWGQFLKISGKINPQRQEAFSKGVRDSNNISELVRSFPIDVTLYRGRIEGFFKYYQTDVGKDTYSENGVMYNYDMHPKGDDFLDYYFDLAPLKSFIQELNSSDKQLRVLDLGSGAGRESERIRRELPAAKVMSIDISDKGSKTGKDLFNLDQVQGDINLPPFANGQIDAIHCKDVLVHVPNKDVFLKNISRMLAPGGTLLLAAAEDTYEGYKQYDWSPYQIETIGKKYGLELISKVKVQMQKEDWYSEKKGRTFILLKKALS